MATPLSQHLTASWGKKLLFDVLADKGGGKKVSVRSAFRKRAKK